MNENTSESERRKRKSYTIFEKLQAVEEVKKKYGNNLSAAERAMSISRKQLRTWIAEENKLRQCSKKQKTRRQGGAGRRPYFKEVETQLFEWVRSERSMKRSISWSRLQREAKSIAGQMNLPNFICSHKWIGGFMKRHRLAIRQVTHLAQQDNRPPEERAQVARLHLASVSESTKTLSSDEIFNMDEIPCYVDMCSERTITFKGERSVGVMGTGHSKTRFTVVLCISMSGELLKTLVILKGLKKVPKVKVPNDLLLAVSPGGSMTERLMLFWVDRAFRARGPFSLSRPSLLLLDNFGSHKVESVKEALKQMRAKTELIPPGTTSYFQPLDVAVNAAFKIRLRQEWEKWFSEGEKEYTSKGYRKRPSWQQVVNFVTSATRSLNRESFTRAFQCCGIGARGASVPEEQLNLQLRQVLSVATNESFASDNDHEESMEIDTESEDDSSQEGGSSSDDDDQ